MSNTGKQTEVVETERIRETGSAQAWFWSFGIFAAVEAAFVVKTVAVQRCETTAAGEGFQEPCLPVISLGRQKEVKHIMFTACETRRKGCWACPFHSDLLSYRLFLNLIRDPIGTADEQVRVVKDSSWEVTLGAGELCVPEKADLGRAAAWPSWAAGILSWDSPCQEFPALPQWATAEMLTVRSSSKEEVTVITCLDFRPRWFLSSKLLFCNSLQQLLKSRFKKKLVLACHVPVQCKHDWPPDKVSKCSHVV